MQREGGEGGSCCWLVDSKSNVENVSVGVRNACAVAPYFDVVPQDRYLQHVKFLLLLVMTLSVEIRDCSRRIA